MSRGCPFLDGEGGREINLNSGEFGWSNVVVNHCENWEFRDYVIVLSFFFFFSGEINLSFVEKLDFSFGIGFERFRSNVSFFCKYVRLGKMVDDELVFFYSRGN